MKFTVWFFWPCYIFSEKAYTFSQCSNKCGRGLQVCLLRNWIDLDKTWLMGGSYEEINAEEFLAELLNWLYLAALERI